MSRRVAIALQIDEPYPHHQEVLAGIGRDAQEHADWEWLIDEHPAYDARRRREPVTNPPSALNDRRLVVRSATGSPLTLAATQWSPTSEWIA